MKKERLFALAGISTPLLLFSGVIILGWLEPGYSHLAKAMSVLGGVAGVRGLLFNVGIALVGLLIILFSIGLNRVTKSKAVLVLLIIAGLGLVVLGVFHCDQNCTNLDLKPKLSDFVHTPAAFVTALGLVLTPFFVYARFRKDPAWKKYAHYTLVTGILTLLLGMIFWMIVVTKKLLAIEGLTQRLGVIFVMVWIGVISIKMLKE